jgi:hypothetical protein
VPSIGAASIVWSALCAAAALHRFLPLVRRKLRLAAEFHATRHGAGAAFARPCTDQLALEFGEASEHGEHEAAVRRRGVCPCVAERAKASLLACNRREGVEKVACRARQAVETRHHEHVACVEPVEDTAELAAVGLGSTCHLAEHLLGPGSPKLGHLSGGALTVGRDSCIAVNHGAILHQNYAPEKPFLFSGLVLVRKS